MNTLDKVIELLEKEVDRIKKLSFLLTQTGLLKRGEYRKKEAARLDEILDLLVISRHYTIGE